MYVFCWFYRNIISSWIVLSSICNSSLPLLHFSNKKFFLTLIHSILCKSTLNCSVFKCIVLFFLPTLPSKCTLFLPPHSTLLFHSIQQEDLYLVIASAIRSILQQFSSSSRPEIPSRLTSTISQLIHLHLSLPLPPSMLLMLDDGVWAFLRSFPPPSLFLSSPPSPSPSPSPSSSPSSKCRKGKRAGIHRGKGNNNNNNDNDDNDMNNNNDDNGGEERLLPSTFLYQALMDLRVVCTFPPICGIPKLPLISRVYM